MAGGEARCCSPWRLRMHMIREADDCPRIPVDAEKRTDASFREVPQLPHGFEEAQALIADFQAGTAYREQVDKIGKTLEILFARSLRDQEPVDFKTAAKQMVRRACTTGVGYVEIGF